MITNRFMHVLAPLAIVALAATACSDDQRRALGEEDVRDSLRASVEQVLEQEGDSVDGDGLDCTSSIGADGSVEGACAGSTDDGDAVAAAYSGTADVAAETCTAEMTITVGEQALPTESGVDCFAT